MLPQQFLPEDLGKEPARVAVANRSDLLDLGDLGGDDLHRASLAVSAELARAGIRRSAAGGKRRLAGVRRAVPVSSPCERPTTMPIPASSAPACAAASRIG